MKTMMFVPMYFTFWTLVFHLYLLHLFSATKIFYIKYIIFTRGTQYTFEISIFLEITEPWNLPEMAKC